MPDRDPHLEKTTQTDLLYGLTLEVQGESDVAVVDPPPSEFRDESARDEERTADAIVQQAATRADSSLARQVQSFNGMHSQAAGRWRSLDGYVPPERTLNSHLPVVTEAEPRATPRRQLLTILRGSQACAVSFVLHVVLLPTLVLLGFPLSMSHPRTMFKATHARADHFEVIELPVLVAVPAHYEAHLSQPVTMELSLPDPRFEKGAMPGLLTDEAPVAITTAEPSQGPVDDVKGLADAGGQGKAQQGKGQGGADFFGTKASGNNFVFVVDCSLSMLEDDRWIEAANELCLAIDRLTPAQRFYVILFDGGIHRMFNHEERQSTLLPATDENKRLFKQWLATVRLGYETRPYLAIKNAVELRPDAIYLLSDGDFKDPTADYLKKFNRPFDHFGNPQQQSVVHTFSFHSRVGQAVMRRIARENGGQYLFVPSK